MSIPDEEMYESLTNDLENNDNKEIDIQQKVELQNYVKEWLNYDDEIKTLQEAIKERKKYKNDIGKVIISFMDNNNIPHFNLSDGKLIFVISL